MLGYFPIAGKSTKVTPIPKPRKPPFDPNGLLCTLSKLLEQVEAHRLNSFIYQNQIPPLEQSGFCQQHSTVSQLARITNFITHGFNLSKHTGMVLLDIEKAYDTGTKQSTVAWITGVYRRSHIPSNRYCVSFWW